MSTHETQKFTRVVDLERQHFHDMVKRILRKTPLGTALGETVEDVMWCLSHVRLPPWSSLMVI